MKEIDERVSGKAVDIRLLAAAAASLIVLSVSAGPLSSPLSEASERTAQARYPPSSLHVSEVGRVVLKTQGSVRTLIADPSLLAKLEGLREQAFSAAEPDEFVIAQIDGSPIDPSNYTKWLSKLGRSVGVHVSPHRLRHTAATLMLNQSIPLSAIGAVLGHTDVRTTLIYARVTRDIKTAAISALREFLDAL